LKRPDVNNDKIVKANDNSNDEGDSDDDEDIDEEMGYISPLDSVDPYITFKQALGSEFFSSLKFLFCFALFLLIIMIVFEVSNPQMYQMATTSLDIEQQTQLMEIIRQAEKNVMVPLG